VASSQEIRAELEKVVNSQALAGSDQLKRLLRVVVDRTLIGKADSVKEYTLGVEALGRPEDFDPKTDPIVRVQARRLRSKLEEYYAAEGATDAVVIRIPKGGYVPSFQSNATRPRWWIGLGVAAAVVIVGLVGWAVLKVTPVDPTSIAVLPIRNLTGDPGKQFIADKTTEALLTELARVKALHVVSGTTTRRFANSQDALPEIARQLGVRWVVEGATGFERGQVLLKIRLVDGASDQKIWADVFTTPVEYLSSMQSKAAAEIVVALRGFEPLFKP
jgi:TolB-like protein